MGDVKSGLNTPSSSVMITMKTSKRRVLYTEGERVRAENFDKLMKDKNTYLDPYSPRTTFARQVVSRKSYNQYRSDFRFGKQHKKQVFSIQCV